MKLIHRYFDRFFGPYARVALYIIAGGLAFCADLGTLTIAEERIHMPLVPAVAIAFLVGFCVSFLCQKYLAFRNTDLQNVHSQAVIFFIVALISFFLNMLLMYVLVDEVHMWYVIAKIVVAGTIAFITFFIYRGFVFK